MSYATEDRDCIKYRLLGSLEPAGSWGHEYVRHLSGEIIAEYQCQTETNNTSMCDLLLKQALDIVPFFMKHNAEADACDLLIELEALEKLPSFVDKITYSRVCLYIVGYMIEITLDVPLM